MDNELDPITLFKLNTPPVDLAKFLIIFDKNGMNLFNDALITNLRLPSEKLLALIHGKTSNPKALNEYVVDRVKKIIEPIQIAQIAEWMNDYKLDFKRFVPMKIKKGEIFVTPRESVIQRIINFVTFRSADPPIKPI